MKTTPPKWLVFGNFHNCCGIIHTSSALLMDAALCAHHSHQKLMVYNTLWTDYCDFFLKFIIGLLTTFLYVCTILNSICMTLLQFWLFVQKQNIIIYWNNKFLQKWKAFTTLVVTCSINLVMVLEAILTSRQMWEKFTVFVWKSNVA